MLYIHGTAQGASALLPVLHAADTPKEGLQASQDIVDLAEVYRDGCAAGGPGVKESKVGERAPGCSTLETGEAVREAARDVIGQAVRGEEDWETAGDRMEGCLRGGFSLTSLDVSSPLVTPGCVERWVFVRRDARCASCRPWLVLARPHSRPWESSMAGHGSRRWVKWSL